MSSMITFRHKGDFSLTYAWSKRVYQIFKAGKFSRYGKMGVDALASATPYDSGKTAMSWVYEVIFSKGGVSIVWSNTNSNDGVNIAVILQYGHGTGTGGYVEGRDYINPAIQPVFDQIVEELWGEVTAR